MKNVCILMFVSMALLVVLIEGFPEKHGHGGNGGHGGHGGHGNHSSSEHTTSTTTAAARIARWANSTCIRIRVNQAWDYQLVI
jgi:hypothetical protein